jgi:hypothetical protein
MISLIGVLDQVPPYNTFNMSITLKFQLMYSKITFHSKDCRWTQDDFMIIFLDPRELKKLNSRACNC